MWADRICDYHINLKFDLDLPNGVEVIDVYTDQETIRCMREFYGRFYHDDEPRTILFGINPGRFGAGVTGVPFTDPVRLEDDCGIPNAFDKRAELSSTFVYDCINTLGGPSAFYSRYYISSVFPLGFLKEGKNYNYYDSPQLIRNLMPMIRDHISEQISFGALTDKAFSIGKGRNFDILRKLNDEENYFDEVIPLPHPRWVMQYRLKLKTEFIDEYVRQLS